jgi:4-hydroxy-3-methylbut-2-en-1-yl diphosphate reductase
MKIILANPRGFCAGVNMAIDVVDQVLKLLGPPVYVFHEIVHNRHVVEDFRSRGVVFVDTIDEVPDGGVIVYSAHGVSPQVRRESKERNLREVDATCPLVTKVHLEVLRFAKEGYHIIFIGHRNHDEAVGTVGEAPDRMTVVESADEVAELPFTAEDKLAFVTQTTLSVSDAERIISALKNRFPDIKAPPKEDICYATTNRQRAVSELARDAEMVLVIGSKNSSNSQRLVETARERGKAAYLIDDEAELQPGWFVDCKSVFVTAGASAPEHLVQNLVARLQRDFGGSGGEPAAVEVRTLVDEDVAFAAPASLKKLTVLR